MRPREEEIRAWPGRSTGILTERTTTLDIDVTDPDAAQYIEELARDMFGEAGTVLVRFGSRPKRAIPLRTATPFAKIVYRFTDPNGEEAQNRSARRRAAGNRRRHAPPHEEALLVARHRALERPARRSA